MLAIRRAALDALLRHYEDTGQAWRNVTATAPRPRPRRRGP